MKQRRVLDEAREQVERIIDALEQPIGSADRAGGWSATKARRCMPLFEKLRAELRGEAPRPKVIDASNHLLRWLDHESIVSGPLLDEMIAGFQATLVRVVRSDRRVRRPS